MDTLSNWPKKTGAQFIHPFDNEDVIVGQGTLGLEILDQNPVIDTVVVPVGGGGLLAGMAFAVKNINPNEIASTIIRLIERTKPVVEPAGAQVEIEVVAAIS